ncbi:MAG: 2Fe-2S iron-sulfur cluster-binding protein [Nanoarchaeota archaeon]
MAILELDGMEKETPDGAPIIDSAESLGVPFGCTAGSCGTCRIIIIDGKKNLSELTEIEKEMADRDVDHRLACQCRITGGKVRITLDR